MRKTDAEILDSVLDQAIDIMIEIEGKER